MRWIRGTLMLMAAGLAGCASNAPTSVLAEGPRMIDLYRGTAVVSRNEAGPEAHGASGRERRCRWWLFTWPCGSRAPEAESAAGPGAVGAAATYTRTAANELSFLFPRLPNPDIYIHVLPHLATEARVPVPGYTTAVPLYDRVQYALPGELEHVTPLPAPASGAAEAAESGKDP